MATWDLLRTSWCWIWGRAKASGSGGGAIREPPYQPRMKSDHSELSTRCRPKM